jgi:multidrug resistance efflux pump
MTHTSWGTGHRALGGAALFLALALAGCDRSAEPPPASMAAGTGTPGTQAPSGQPTVEPSAAERTVTADGRLVQPLQPQALSFGASGQITEVLVEAGQPVGAGQIVARIDAAPLDLAVADARAAVAQAQASLTRLETGGAVETARLDVERAKNQLWGIQAQRDAICGAHELGQKEGGLAKMAAPSSADCDGAQANVQAAEQGVQIAEAQARAAEASAGTDLNSARAALQRARMGLAQANQNRANADLTAPFTGTVTVVHLLPGLNAGPGMPVVTMEPEGPLEFVTDNLSERDVADVDVGSLATVTFNAFPNEPVDAIVGRIDAGGTVSPEGVVVYAAHLYLAGETELQLRAGMTGRAEIQAVNDQ